MSFRVAKRAYASDVVDAIHLVLEGAKDDGVAIETISKILEKYAPTPYQTRGTESVRIFVDVVRELKYSFAVNQG